MFLSTPNLSQMATIKIRGVSDCAINQIKVSWFQSNTSSLEGTGIEILKYKKTLSRYNSTPDKVIKILPTTVVRLELRLVSVAGSLNLRFINVCNKLFFNVY